MNKIVNRVEISGIIQGFKAGSEIRDLKVGKTTTGKSVLHFKIKHNEITYIDVVAFETIAEEIVRLNQGQYVCLKGTWTKYGRTDNSGKKIWSDQLNVSKILDPIPTGSHILKDKSNPPNPGEFKDELPW